MLCIIKTNCVNSTQFVELPTRATYFSKKYRVCKREWARCHSLITFAKLYLENIHGGTVRQKI